MFDMMRRTAIASSQMEATVRATEQLQKTAELKAALTICTSPRSYKLSRVELTFTSASGKAPILLDLSDAEHEVIKAYREEYRRLGNSAISKKELPCNLSIKSGDAVPITANLPSEDDLAVLLHRLRPFILHEEPASFNRTTAILGRHLTHPTVRTFLRELRREWRGERFFDEIAVLLNSTPIDGEKLLLDWLNAKEYHRDPGKSEAVEKLRSRMPEPLVDFVIASLALDRLRAVRKGGAVTRLILGELRSLRIDGGCLERGGA